MSSSQAGPSTSLLKDAISGAGPKVTACQACTSLIARTGDELLCGGCKVSFYCDVECQKADWLERHKQLCPMFQNKQVFTNTELSSLSDDPSFARMLQKSSFEPYRPYFENGTAADHYYEIIIIKDPANPATPKLFSAKMRKRPERENIHQCAMLEAESNPHMARCLADPDLFALTLYLTTGTSTWPATFIASSIYLTEMSPNPRWKIDLALSLSQLTAIP